MPLKIKDIYRVMVVPVTTLCVVLLGIYGMSWQPVRAEDKAVPTPTIADVAVPPVVIQPAANVTQPQPSAKANRPPKEALPPSVFFTTDAQQKMHEAMAEYEKSLLARLNSGVSKVGDEAARLIDTELKKMGLRVEEKTFTYPQFFLDSLVYHDEKDWTVLINKARLSAKVAQSGDISIISVDNEKVLVEWKPKKMERVNESWAQYKNDTAKVDVLEGTVRFTLRPNQTFSSYVMRVIEGRVKPVTVDIKSGDSDAQNASQPNPAAPANIVVKNSENKGNDDVVLEGVKSSGTINPNVKTGIKDLHNTYQKMGLEK